MVDTQDSNMQKFLAKIEEFSKDKKFRGKTKQKALVDLFLELEDEMVQAWAQTEEYKAVFAEFKIEPAWTKLDDFVSFLDEENEKNEELAKALYKCVFKLNFRLKRERANEEHKGNAETSRFLILLDKFDDDQYIEFAETEEYVAIFKEYDTKIAISRAAA